MSWEGPPGYVAYDLRLRFHTPKEAPSSISARSHLSKPLFLQCLASFEKSRTQSSCSDLFVMLSESLSPKKRRSSVANKQTMESNMELRRFKTDPLWHNLRLTIDQSALPDETASSLLEFCVCAEKAYAAGPTGFETLAGALSDISRVAADGISFSTDITETLTPAEVACQRSLVAVLVAVQVLCESLCLTELMLAKAERNRRCQVGGPNDGRCVDAKRSICIERKIGGRFACASIAPLSLKALEAVSPR